MNLGSAWRWWRTLPQNPVYLREKGGWGNPNPFYTTLSRYSPFVVIGAIFFGVCAGSNNPALLAGDSELLAFWCFLCLPGMLLSALTIFASLMAPALTAPSISLERDRGTWDILRVTPQPTRSILFAKLFGALARLRIWPLLFALSLLQGLLLACSISLVGGRLAIWGWLLGLTTVIRPWLEIIFAALLGTYLSTWARSATVALAATYTILVLFKVLNSSTLWLGVFSLLAPDYIVLVAGLGPTAVYALAMGAVGIGIVQRANKLEYG